MRMYYSKMLVLAILGLGFGLVMVGCGGGNTPRLEGSGSTFVDPMMQEWATHYNSEKGVQVNYQSKGSSAGMDMMTNMEVDFGCSDTAMDDERLKRAVEKGGEVLHIPVCMGGVVPAYNLEGNPELVFSGEVIGRIYLGTITKWNDPAIKALNPKASLPDSKIVSVRRSDGSGTTYVFVDYLKKVLKDEWTPGVGTTIEWPVSNGQKGNEGVAGFIKRTQGSFGYIELAYAKNGEITYGSVINVKGKAVQCSPKSVTAAAATATIPEDLRYTITNSSGEDAYPIAGTVFAIVYAKQPADKADRLRAFLHWATHEGQKYTESLHYSSLPENLVKKVEAKLDQIKAK